MVGGDYILNVTIMSYSSNGRCSQCNDESLYGCCDDWESTSCGSVGNSRRCDTYFQYCLLDSGTAFNLPITCNIRAQSTQATSNGAAIDFSQSTVLGLSNPLTLSGNLPTYPVRTKDIILCNLTAVWQGNCHSGNNTERVQKSFHLGTEYEHVIILRLELYRPFCISPWCFTTLV